MNLDEIRKRVAWARESHGSGIPLPPHAASDCCGLCSALNDNAELLRAVEAADELVESTSEFDPSDFPELWDTFDARRTAYLKVRGDA